MDLSEKIDEAVASPSFSQSYDNLDNWWELFSDEQLGNLIAMGLKSHPDIQLALSKLKEASFFVCLARSPLLPHIDFEGDIGRTKISKNSADFFPLFAEYTQTTLQLDINYDLDIWGKNRFLLYAALGEEQARLAELEEAKLLLSVAIASAYFEWEKTQKRVFVAFERLKRQEKRYELLKLSFERGLIAKASLYEMATLVEGSKQLIEELTSDLKRSENALAALVENPSGIKCCCLPPHLKFCDSFPLPCNLPLDLISRRPDITAKKWRIEAALNAVQVAQVNFYPNLNLVGNVMLQSILFSKLFQAQSFGYMYDFATHLPIFDYGKLQAELGIAGAHLEESIAEYNQTILKAVQEVSDWLAILTHLDNRIELQSEQIADLQEVVTLTSKHFERGLENEIGLLTAELALLEKQDQYLILETNKLHAALGLIKSLGGGYDDRS